LSRVAHLLDDDYGLRRDLVNQPARWVDLSDDLE
jgi:hypothetical protein